MDNPLQNIPMHQTPPAKAGLVSKMAATCANHSHIALIVIVVLVVLVLYLFAQGKGWLGAGKKTKGGTKSTLKANRKGSTQKSSKGSSEDEESIEDLIAAVEE